jgi:hypothetical protein
MLMVNIHTAKATDLANTQVKMTVYAILQQSYGRRGPQAAPIVKSLHRSKIVVSPSDEIRKEEKYKKARQFTFRCIFYK